MGQKHHSMTAFPFDLAKQYLPNGVRVIFDVGAYDFADSFRFAKVWPEADVHAFEADREQGRGIVYELNCPFRIQYCAVTDFNGEIEFHFGKDTAQGGNCMSGSILKPTQQLKADAPNLTFDRVQTVPCIRLDTYCAKSGIDRVDIAHLDVQGAEYKVLLGLGAIRPTLIYLETNETAEAGHYEGAASILVIVEWLKNAGYAKVWNTESDALWALQT